MIQHCYLLNNFICISEINIFQYTVNLVLYCILDEKLNKIVPTKKFKVAEKLVK